MRPGAGSPSSCRSSGVPSWGISKRLRLAFGQKLPVRHTPRRHLARLLQLDGTILRQTQICRIVLQICGCRKCSLILNVLKNADSIIFRKIMNKSCHFVHYLSFERPPTPRFATLKMDKFATAVDLQRKIGNNASQICDRRKFAAYRPGCRRGVYRQRSSCRSRLSDTPHVGTWWLAVPLPSPALGRRGLPLMQ